MSHLSPDDLLDLAEGARPDASSAHLAACESCRRDLAELRDVLRVATDVEVPEPSPLFWDHLSGRVRDAVAAEAPAGQRLFDLSAWRDAWRPALGSGILAVAAVAVIVAVVTIRSGRGPLTPESPAQAPAVAALEPVVEPPLDSSDTSPSFELMADMTADMDLDTAVDAGLLNDSTADHAVAHLTDTELRELARLLQEEIGQVKPS